MEWRLIEAGNKCPVSSRDKITELDLRVELLLLLVDGGLGWKASIISEKVPFWFNNNNTKISFRVLR